MSTSDQAAGQQLLLIQELLRRVEQLAAQNRVDEPQVERHDPVEAFEDGLKEDSEDEEVQVQNAESCDFSELSKLWGMGEAHVTKFGANKASRPWIPPEERAAELKGKNREARLQASENAEEYLELIRGVLRGARAPLSRSDQAMVAATLSQLRGQLIRDVLTDLLEEQHFEADVRALDVLETECDKLLVKVKLILERQRK